MIFASTILFNRCSIQNIIFIDILIAFTILYHRVKKRKKKRPKNADYIFHCYIYGRIPLQLKIKEMDIMVCLHFSMYSKSVNSELRRTYTTNIGQVHLHMVITKTTEFGISLNTNLY